MVPENCFWFLIPVSGSKITAITADENSAEIDAIAAAPFIAAIVITGDV